MTLPLRANWITASDLFGAADQNAVETVVNAMGAGTLRIPKNPWISPDATLALSTVYNVYIHTGAGSVWTLPAVAGNTNSPLQLINRGSGTVTVVCAGSDLLYAHAAGTTYMLPPASAIDFINDGTYWLASSGGVGKYPTFDNVSQKTISANPATWTHAVGTGTMGAVIVIYGSGTAPSGITGAVISLGGVTFTDHGWATSPYDSSWFWFFFGTGIPAGSQTASVAGGFAGGTGAYCLSYYDCGFAAPAAIFTDASWSGLYQTQWGFSVPCRRSSSAPGVIVSATTAPADSGTPTQRVGLLVGDQGVCGGDPARVGYHMTGGSAHTGILELLATAPTEPWVNAVGPGGTTSWSHNGPAGSYGLVIAYATTITGVTWGGAAMTQIGSYQLASGAYLKFYGKASAASGAQTIAVTGTGINSCNSFTLTGVNAVGTPTTGGAPGAAGYSQTVTPTPGQLILQCTASDNGYGNNYTDSPLYVAAGLYVHAVLVPTTVTTNAAVYLTNGNYGAIAIPFS